MLTSSPKQPLMEPLKDFQRLGPSIFLYEPPSLLCPSPTSTVIASPPSVTILTTWMSASPRHIVKYTNAYKTLFPHTPIIVITTSAPDMVYRPYSTQQASLTPVLRLLLRYAQDAPTSGVLLHTFSNGGAHKACQLARTYKSQTGSALKIGALVLDSSPGVATFARTTAAMMVGLPSSPVARTVLSVLVYALLGMLWLTYLLLPGDNVVQRMRKDLNNPNLFGRGNERLYIYSTEDRMVGWEDVESHSREAEERDWHVRREKWAKPSHVGHMAVDGERYWGAVKSLWKVASVAEH
jgi:hypothetical protein